MRLIDADALEDYIDSDESGLLSAREYKHDYIACIDDMPTIDPVKHGRWVTDERPHDVDARCSCCGICCAAMNERYHGRYKLLGCKNPLTWYNYCPFCGAKMDGKAD